MGNEKISLMNTSIDNLSMEETIDKVEQAIHSKKQLHHVVVNAGKLVAMKTDLDLRKSVNESDIINADGQAVVWASKFLGKPLKERVAGIDLMEKLVELAHAKSYRIYFLGATQSVIETLVEKYSKVYSSNIIAGYRNGYFLPEEQLAIAKEIGESGAQMLFVAISSPTKENFLFNHKDALSNVSLIMGVGGSFDVVAGKVKRAPLWMQKSGLEWLYRLLQEPKRMWKRYLVGNTKFILLMLSEKFKAQSK